MSSSDFSLAWLVPNFSEASFATAEGLSAAVVITLLAILLLAGSFFTFKYWQARSQISWFNKKLIDGLNRENVAQKRSDLTLLAKQTKHKTVKHIWLEFDETLVEVQSPSGVNEVRNTIDFGHFFNTHTIAKGVTDNRFVAAIPGVLTAIGVIGTFVGLQLGLAGLDLGGDVEQMREGIASVVNGAKVAFLTSVWGIVTSLLFNVYEKLLEQSIRNKIQKVETKVDWIFPRIRPEEQLLQIAKDGHESRDALQGLAEKIGDKMQESLLQVTESIQTELRTSLEEVMKPAVDRFVSDTSEGNQKALEDLLEKFMEGFGEQGSQQRSAMDDASHKVSQAVEQMNTVMQAFVNRMEQAQSSSSEREQALISTISNQVDELLTNSREHTEQLATMLDGKVSQLTEQIQTNASQANQENISFLEELKTALSQVISEVSSQTNSMRSHADEHLTSLTERFEQRDQNAQQSNAELQQAITQQTNQSAELAENLLQRVVASSESAQHSAQQILAQGKSLQASVESSVHANAQATQSMKESAQELRVAAENMNVLSNHVKEAGNTLAGAIGQAVDSTKELAAQNQLSSEQMQTMREQLVADTQRFSDISQRLESLFDKSENTFAQLSESQQQFLSQQKQNIDALNEQIMKLLNDYAERANGQTAEHLRVWSSETSNYATQMNKAYKTLNNIVDEIETKLGAAV